jgi:hypothetical protein
MRPLADQGHVTAQTVVGLMYYFNYGEDYVSAYGRQVEPHDPLTALPPQVRQGSTSEGCFRRESGLSERPGLGPIDALISAK